MTNRPVSSFFLWLLARMVSPGLIILALALVMPACFDSDDTLPGPVESGGADQAEDDETGADLDLDMVDFGSCISGELGCECAMLDLDGDGRTAKGGECYGPVCASGVCV